MLSCGDFCPNSVVPAHHSAGDRQIIASSSIFGLFFLFKGITGLIA
jgi:hypothetical protein